MVGGEDRPPLRCAPPSRMPIFVGLRTESDTLIRICSKCIGYMFSVANRGALRMAIVLSSDQPTRHERSRSRCSAPCSGGRFDADAAARLQFIPHRGDRRLGIALPTSPQTDAAARFLQLVHFDHQPHIDARRARTKWLFGAPRNTSQCSLLLFAAAEVRAAGWGGLKVVARITGLARSTINRGEDDLDGEPLPN